MLLVIRLCDVMLRCHTSDVTAEFLLAFGAQCHGKSVHILFHEQFDFLNGYSGIRRATPSGPY